MSDLIVTLGLPDKALSPNTSVHWRTLAAKKKAYRRDAWLCAVAATRAVGLHCRVPEKTIDVEPVFFHAVNRRRDGDNAAASIKAALDGIQDAGVVEDDSGIRLMPARFEIDKARPRLELHIRKAP